MQIGRKFVITKEYLTISFCLMFFLY